MMDRGEIAGGRVGVWVSLGRVRDGLVEGWLCCGRSDEDGKRMRWRDGCFAIPNRG